MEEYFVFTEKEKSYLVELFKSQEERLSPYAAKSADAIRKPNGQKRYYDYRGEYSKDIDRILHNALYNRYGDKTQVFSFYRNDDITRRALHVQLVSRIAKLIGVMLKLNIDLIEAIALGHDMGHTPFGHKGEKYLNDLYNSETGRYFNHNVHSVRVLKEITDSNLSLQTYDGILCHCGEKVCQEYRPHNVDSFEEFEKIYEKCYVEPAIIKDLRPSTLEGCVVRVSDMIAYVGKDRQDASKADLFKLNDFPSDELLGSKNYEIISRMIINLVKNSIEKDYLSMDKEVFSHFDKIQKQNYKMIYNSKDVAEPYESIVRPMMEKLYERLLSDIKNRKYDSPVFKHHLNHPILGNCYRKSSSNRSIVAEPNDIVVDYIASMTDDYFLDLFKYVFPSDPLNDKVKYVEYF